MASVILSLPSANSTQAASEMTQGVLQHGVDHEISFARYAAGPLLHPFHHTAQMTGERPRHVIRATAAHRTGPVKTHTRRARDDAAAAATVQLREVLEQPVAVGQW
ncbi:hypothetical protein ABZ918_33660 [Streptomyces viridosporus]|uniref:hypothetical protein n=2 Tax=Streptomyces viridosporus TaxID=67581 RepID=UPI00344A4E6E